MEPGGGELALNARYAEVYELEETVEGIDRTQDTVQTDSPMADVRNSTRRDAVDSSIVSDPMSPIKHVQGKHALERSGDTC